MQSLQVAQWDVLGGRQIRQVSQYLTVVIRPRNLMRRSRTDGAAAQEGSNVLERGMIPGSVADAK